MPEIHHKMKILFSNKGNSFSLLVSAYKQNQVSTEVPKKVLQLFFKLQGPAGENTTLIVTP